MNYMAKEKLETLEGRTLIRNDRELLSHLGMSDAVAASYLGKSRQALHLKLGPQNSDAQRPPYFKMSEILVLVMAARQRGREFDRKALLAYVGRTKERRSGSSADSMQILAQLLGAAGRVDLKDAGTVVMILPDFADQREKMPGVSEDLRHLSEELRAMQPVPWVAVFSSTLLQARMAAAWLELPSERTREFRHDYVDHYVPCLLVFPREGGHPRPYVVTDDGGIVPAPQFRASVMGESVRYMLPAEAREELFTFEKGGGSEDVRPRKRA